MFIVYGILILSIIVFIHELGHFLAARICGVKVEAFSIGMGPVLFHKKIGDVDWRISLLLFGGYCAMKGEKKEDENVNEDPDSFYGTSPFKRAFIAFCGPMANFLFAVVSFTIIAMTGYYYFSSDNTIKLVTDVEEYKNIHSPAKEAGILTGDKILSINGKETPDFMALYEEVGSRPDENITLKILRNNEELEFIVHTDLDLETGLGKIGITSNPETAELKLSKTYSFFPAIGQGFLQTCNYLGLTVKGIAVLFKGVDVTKAVSGPVRITSMLGTAVEDGFSAGLKNGICNILQFIAIINISLFFMNLLPIPVLDGSLIIFALIEGIFKKRISPKAENIIQYIGIGIIVFLMFFGITTDIKYLMGN